MYILGINLSHHASVCLFKNESLIFYLEHDRITGDKEAEFITNEEVESLKLIANYTSHIDHIIFSSFGKNHLYNYPDKIMIDHFKSKFENYKITYDNIHFYNEHHLYHATNAFYSSKFDEAAVLILDGGGIYYNDYILLREVESMYYFSDLEFEVLKKHYSISHIFHNDKPINYNEKTVFSSTLSCGWIFNTIRALSEKSPGHIMCLSSYGDLEKVPQDDWFLYDEKTDSWYTDNSLILDTYRKYTDIHNIDPYVNRGRFLLDHGSNFPYQTIANIAKKAQKETRDHTVRLIRQLLEKCNTKNVVLSGGYMLNCVNNYEYLKEFPDINFYIDPIAHDGGTCIGAAKYLWHNVLKNSKRDTLKTLYLG